MDFQEYYCNLSKNGIGHSRIDVCPILIVSAELSAYKRAVPNRTVD